MKTTWCRRTKFLVGTGFVFLGIFVLYLSRLVIPPLVVAALNAVIVRPIISWLHLHIHLSCGLAVGLIYPCLAILSPPVVVLILPTIIDALIYVESLDYRSILESGAKCLRSTLTTIKDAQLPVAAFDAYVDRAIDTVLEAFQSSSPTAAVPPSLERSSNHSVPR